MDRNYYLVNKETNAIHAYFRTDLEKSSPFPQGQKTIAGEFHIPETPELTLEGLRAMRITPSDMENFKWDEYYTETGFGSIENKFIPMGKLNVISYKNNRIFDYSDNLVNPLYRFKPHQMVELIAFLAALFKQEMGPRIYDKWSVSHGIDDKYGVYSLLMKYFSIESDDNVLIYNAPELINDGSED